MRVVICEDLVLLRDGLASLLTDDGNEVVAAVGDGDALIAAVDEHHPKLAIIDVRLPPTQTDEGVRAAVEVRAPPPRRRPSSSSASTSRSATPPTCSAAAARASATCSRTASPTCASSSRPRAASPRGGTAIDPEVVSQLLSRRQRTDVLDELTPREREVLGLMAEGHSNGAIAERLVVTNGAVEKHVSSVFMKLGLPPTDQQHRRVLAVLTYLGV